MANGLYDAARSAFLDANIDWSADTIKVALIDAADYTRNLTTHDFWDDVGVAARVAISSALGSKTSTAGTADAADVTWSSVTGDQSEEVVCYSDTAGADSTDPLIFDMDTFASGMPVTPNGGNIVIAWNASGMFKL